MARVVLRKRKGKKRTTLSLAIWYPEDRKWKYRKEKLNLFLYPGKTQQNKDTMKIAEEARDNLQREVSAGALGIVPPSQKREDFIAFFEQMAIEKGRNWTPVLFRLKQYTKGLPVPFNTLNEDWLTGLREFLFGVVKHNTAWNYEAKIRKALKQAFKEKKISQDLRGLIDPLKFKKTKRTFLTQEEIQRLIDTPCRNPEVKAAFLFACFAGLRYSDVRALTWKNVVGDSIEVTQIKTGELVILPLNAMAKKILEERKGKIIDPTERIFVLGHNGETNDFLREWARVADIKKRVTFHASRHSYAGLLLEMGLSDYHVSKALGLDSTAMVKVYAHYVQNKLTKRIDEGLPAFKIGGAK